jgi:hypothetical protein
MTAVKSRPDIELPDVLYILFNIRTRSGGDANCWQNVYNSSQRSQSLEAGKTVRMLYTNTVRLTRVLTLRPDKP